jgi:nitrite reductase/ring-hydroxylating ferredoxin subunit
MSTPRTVRVALSRFGDNVTVATELAGRRVLVAKTCDGVFACTDRCPHRGAPLSMGGKVVTPLVGGQGRLELGAPSSSLRCPWHKWDFDLASGTCAVDARLRLRTYHAWVDGEEVVVSLDPPATEVVA